MCKSAHLGKREGGKEEVRERKREREERETVLHVPRVAADMQPVRFSGTLLPM